MKKIVKNQNGENVRIEWKNGFNFENEISTNIVKINGEKFYVDSVKYNYVFEGITVISEKQLAELIIKRKNIIL